MLMRDVLLQSKIRETQDVEEDTCKERRTKLTPWKLTSPSWPRSAAGLHAARCCCYCFLILGLANQCGDGDGGRRWHGGRALCRQYGVGGARRNAWKRTAGVLLLRS